MFEMLGGSVLLVVIIKLDRSRKDKLHRSDETDSYWVCRVWGIAISNPVVLHRLYNGEVAIQVAPHRPVGPVNFHNFQNRRTLKPIYAFKVLHLSRFYPPSHPITQSRRDHFGR